MGSRGYILGSFVPLCTRRFASEQGNKSKRVFIPHILNNFDATSRPWYQLCNDSAHPKSMRHVRRKTRTCKPTEKFGVNESDSNDPKIGWSLRSSREEGRSKLRQSFISEWLNNYFPSFKIVIFVKNLKIAPIQFFVTMHLMMHE